MDIDMDIAISLTNKRIMNTVVDLINSVLMGSSSNATINDYFLGGSRRFGWGHSGSDIDIFVGTDDRYVMVAEMLSSNLFQRDSQFPVEHYEALGTHLETILSGMDVDIIVMDTKDFEELRSEHQLVEDYLVLNPQILLLVCRLRNVSELSGKTVYRSVRDVYVGGRYIARQG